MDPAAQDQVFLTIGDVRRIFAKNKRLYGQLAGICFGSLLCWSMVSSPLYQAEGSFKAMTEGVEHTNALKNVLKSIPLQHADSAVISVMKSRKLHAKVASLLGLQAEVSTEPRGFSFARSVKNNILSELGSTFTTPERFLFEDVLYEGEKKISLFLHVLDEKSFELLDDKKHILAIGSLNQPIVQDDFTFTLKSVPQNISFKKYYPLTLLPIETVIKKTMDHFRVKQSKIDPEVLILTYAHPDRQLSAQFVNTVMHCYMNLQKEEEKTLVNEQLAYFEKRKEELVSTYDAFLEEHQKYLATNLGEEGFMGLKQEIELLEKPKEDYLTKLYEVELELNRITPNRTIKASLEEKKEAFREGEKKLPIKAVHKENKETELNAYQKPYAAMQQKWDEADYHIKQMTVQSDHLQKKEEIKTLVKQKEEIEELIKAVDTRTQVQRQGHLLDDVIPSLGGFIREINILAKQQGISEEERQTVSLKQQKMKKQLQEHKSAIESREIALINTLASQESDEAQLQGLNPETAQQLYVEYNHELDSVAVNIRQLIYLRDQVVNVGIDVSSLSTVLSDPISQQMIQKASQVALDLEDDMNRSLREQERLKETLATQKKFLVHHISELIEMQKLRVKVIEEKISSLQKATIHLLSAEKDLIEDRLHAIRDRMRSLPKKWKLENTYTLKRDLCRSVLEAISQLEESKRISYNAFQIQSRPLDLASPPSLVKRTSVFVFPLTAALLLVAGFYVLHVLRYIARGTHVSKETLQALGLLYQGHFSHSSSQNMRDIHDQDLETLRKTVSFLLEERKSHQVVALLGKEVKNFARSLAELLQLREQKVLVIDCSFASFATSGSSSGLLRFLSGEIDLPTVHREKGYDYIYSGGYVRHFVELLISDKMRAFVEKSRREYDVIVLASGAKADTVEAMVYQSLSDKVIFAVSEEDLLSEFESYLLWQKEKSAPCISFVLC